MKGKSVLWKLLVIKAIVLLVLASIPIAIGSSTSNENEPNTLETKHFNNCFVLLFGKSNDVSGPALWLFGLYCPLIFKKSIGVKATGQEGERISVIIFGDEFGSFIRYENINIQLINAKGIFFYGGKSLITEEPIIFAFCKAETATVIY